MIKTKLLVGLYLVVFFCSASVWADETAPKKIEYKCYLDTTLGYQIAFYKWDAKNRQRNTARLPTKKMPYAGPNKRAYIKDVVECVELDASFSHSLARSLDDKTAR